MPFRLIIITFMTLLMSCKSDTVSKNKTEQTTKTTKTTKRTLGKSSKSDTKKTYWTELQKATGITEQQVAKIKKIEDIGRKEINKAKKENKLTPSLRKEINKKSRKEISTLLGKKQFAKKIEFDKTLEK